MSTALPLNVMKRVLWLDGHWMWTGAKTSSGTPSVGINGRSLNVRQYVFVRRTRGQTSPYLRSCPSTPLCVNPEHLKPLVRKVYQRRSVPIAERFWDCVDKTGECWEWKEYRHPNGYGVLRFQGKNEWAHRAAWRLLHGDIPAKLVIDHLCNNRPCVRPEHLRLTTQRANILRSKTHPMAVNFRKTHCPKGHPYDEANTIHGTTPLGHPNRICRRCRNDWQKVTYQNRKRRLAEKAKSAA
jgi:hypothetical protein